jgi:hypothetical protein
MLTSITGSLSILQAVTYYPICPQQHDRRDRQAERLRGFQVNHHLELGGLLHGEVSGLGPLADLLAMGIVKATSQ